MAGQSDKELLRRYVDRLADAAGAELDAEMAFASLVDRHGPMVWGLCRRSLGECGKSEAHQTDREQKIPHETRLSL